MATSGDKLDKSKLEYGMLDGPDHPDFDKVYACYQKCFPLETEQESKENFLAILADNADTSKPGREMWVYVKDKTTGEVIGASNFDAFPATPGHDIDGTCQGIYMFVDEEHRRKGLFDVLINLREEAAGKYLRSEDPTLPDPPRLATFAEQNNPLMMTPAQYIEDSKAAVDQNERREIFEKRGFRTLEMRYVQPPLEAGGETCDYLDFVAKAPAGRDSLPTEIVRGHLDRFFQKSFSEGTSVDMECFDGMRRDLERAEIPFEARGKFGAMREHLNVEKLEKLPAEHHDTLIGHLQPELVQRYYGGKDVTIEDAMDSAHAVKAKTGHSKNFTTHDTWGDVAAQPRTGWARSVGKKDS